MNRRRPPAEVAVSVVPAGDTVEGLWCPSCLLPSVVAQAFLAVFPIPSDLGYVTQLGVAQVCEDCGLQQSCS